MPKIIREVPGLGVVYSTATHFSDTVVDFLGIPYATVSHRFRRADALQKWNSESTPAGLDASHYGPICPRPPAASAFNLTGAKLPHEEPLVEDEFKCLNLNITTPVNLPSTLLPVVVFIHGGANCFGYGNAPGYYGAKLVDLSARLESPIVYVVLKYSPLIHRREGLELIRGMHSWRNGAFGFLASSDIQEDNFEAGYDGVGNYGIHDQVLALEWIQKHISAFGGDPKRITVWGESAGAGNVHIQMLSPWVQSKQLYSQVIMSSGHAVMTTRSLSHQQRVYEKFLEHLSIPNDLAPEQRLQRLRNVTAEELLDAYRCTGSPLPNWQATVDSILVEALPKTSTLRSAQYNQVVRRILIGDCEKEALIWAAKFRQAGWTMDQIASALEKHFSASTVRRLLSSYNPNGGTTPGDVFHTLERFCGDAEFVQPLDEIARNWNKGQGIDSVFAGHAHHAVDLLFMFQTYNHLLPAEYAEAASEMGGSFIAFINGLDPWVAFAKEHDYPAMCYGPTSVSLVERQRDNITRYTAFDEFGDLQDKWTDASQDLRNETIHG